MATYAFKGRGPAVAYEPNGFCVVKRRVDMPDLLASPNKLALASAPTVGLGVFTGFVQNDILELFEVPAGFMVMKVGARVVTAEGDACAGDIGCNSATQTHLLALDADGFMGTLDLNSAVTQVHLLTDAQLGSSNNECIVYVTDGSIDLTLPTDTTYDAFVADFWAAGAIVF